MDKFPFSCIPGGEYFIDMATLYREEQYRKYTTSMCFVMRTTECINSLRDYELNLGVLIPHQ